MPDERGPVWQWALCQPCWDTRHDECDGANVWCECFTELLIEVDG